MPIAYEELPGSPEINLERRTGSGRRSVIIAWADIEAMMDEIFPDPYLTGYLYGAVMPGYPFLVAKKVAIKPFVENRPRADNEDWTTWHPWAQLDVEYGVPGDDQEQQSVASGGDGTGPGGSEGSSGGQDVTFLSHSVKVGGEFLTYPAGGVEWEEHARVDGDVVERTVSGPSVTTSTSDSTDPDAVSFTVHPFSVPRGKGLELAIGDSTVEVCRILGMKTNADGKVTIHVDRATPEVPYPPGTPVDIYGPSSTVRSQKDVGDDVPTAVSIATIEHSIDWSYVQAPPWLAIRSCAGRVNAYPFAGSPVECALFLGADCSREVTNKGYRTWKMSYKFTEKNHNPFNPLQPMGWNYFLRPTGDRAGQFQRIGKKTPLDEDGNPPETVTTDSIATTVQTVITVNSTAEPFPQYGAFTIKIDNEIMQVDVALSATTWGVKRGIRGTTKTTHASGSVVTMIPSGLYEVSNFKQLFGFV
jgi:hypothetical protein